MAMELASLNLGPSQLQEVSTGLSDDIHVTSETDLDEGITSDRLTTEFAELIKGLAVQPTPLTGSTPNEVVTLPTVELAAENGRLLLPVGESLPGASGSVPVVSLAENQQTTKETAGSQIDQNVPQSELENRADGSSRPAELSAKPESPVQASIPKLDPATSGLNLPREIQVNPASALTTKNAEIAAAAAGRQASPTEDSQAGSDAGRAFTGDGGSDSESARHFMASDANDVVIKSSVGTENSATQQSNLGQLTSTDFESQTIAEPMAVQSSAQVTSHADSSPVPVSQQIKEALFSHIEKTDFDGVKQIELRLDPPDLGKVTIRISSHRDGIVARFVSSNAVARLAINGGLDSLSQSLSSAGINVVRLEVTDNRSDQGSARNSRDWETQIKPSHNRNQQSSGPIQSPAREMDSTVDLIV